MHFALE